MAYIGKSPSKGVRNRFQYQATASQTSFSGADANGLTLTYTDSLYMDVYQNGILLVPGDDYTATTGTTVVLVQAASVDDIVEMVVYDVFSVNDSVSASSGGTFSGNVVMGGTLNVTGAATLSDNLVIGTAGKGIDFSANSNASGMSSELLDHYEEGTFDITIADASSGGNTGSVTQTNKYIRIGNTVWLNFNLININYTGLTTSNVLFLQGLPFTPTSGSNGAGSAASDRIDTETGCFNHALFVNAGQNYASFYQSIDGAESESTKVSAFNNGVSDVFATVMFMV